MSFTHWQNSPDIPLSTSSIFLPLYVLRLFRNWQAR